MPQAFSEAGLRWPCWSMHLSTAICGTLYPYTILYRAAKLIVVSQPKLRKQYMRYFTVRAVR